MRRRRTLKIASMVSLVLLGCLALYLGSPGAALCFGANRTNILSAGKWSEPVRCQNEHGEYCGALRSRLLLCNSTRDGDPDVYFEFQEVSEPGNGGNGGIEFFYNILPDCFGPDLKTIVKATVQWGMKDAAGRPVPEWREYHGYNGPVIAPHWVTLPADSTTRECATDYCGRLEDGRLAIVMQLHAWRIPVRSTNDYFLSCTFTPMPPSTNVPPAPGVYSLWHGTLKLPSLKIPVQRP